MSIEPNAIIQILPPHRWAPSLAVVDEVRKWGVQAYVFVPSNDGAAPGRAFIRLTEHEFEDTGGKNAFVTQDDEPTQ